MARSTFAKYAERFSIGVIALVIVAWAVLSFFSDDSQEPDAVGQDQVDQTEDAVEPDAGAGTEPGAGVPKGDEELESVAGEETDSDQSTVSKPEDGASGDAGTEGGAPPTDDDTAAGADGSSTAAPEVDQPGPTDDADKPGEGVDKEPSGDSSDTGQDADTEADQSTVSKPEDDASGDAGTEGSAPPSGDDTAAGADGSSTAATEDDQPDPTDGAGEPGEGVDKEPSGDSSDTGQDADTEADQSTVSKPEDDASGDAGTEGSAPPSGDDTAAGADGSSTAATEDEQSDQIGQTGPTDDAGDPGTEIDKEPSDDSSDTGESADTEADGGTTDDVQADGGSASAAVGTSETSCGLGDASPEAEQPDECVESQANGSTDDSAHDVDKDTDQTASTGSEDGESDDVGTEGGASPGEDDSAGGADGSSAAAPEDEQSDQVGQTGPTDDVQADGGSAPAADGTSAASCELGNASPEAEQPDECVESQANGSTVDSASDVKSDGAGTEGGVPPSDDDSVGESGDSNTDSTDDDQPGSADGAGGPDAGVEAEPGDDAAADEEAASEQSDAMPDDVDEDGDPATSEEDSKTAVSDGVQADQVDQSDQTDGTGEPDTDLGDEEAKVGDDVDADADQSAATGSEDPASDDSGTEDGTPPIAGDPAEETGDSEAAASDGNQAGHVDQSDQTESADDPSAGAEPGGEAPGDGDADDTGVSGKQVAKLDLDVRIPGKTEPSGETGTPKQEKTVILPSFDVVRVDQFGFATIAGRGMPEWAIDAQINSELTESARIGRDGQFAFVFQLDTEGGPLEIALVSRDGDGTIYRSPETIVVFAPEKIVDPKSEKIPLASEDTLLPAVLVATPEQVKLEQPPIPNRPAGYPGENLQIDSISYDMVGEAVIAGRGSAKGFVRVYLDNSPVKTERISEFGTWEIVLPEVDAGRYMLRIEELDQSRRVVASITTPFQKEFREDAIGKMKEAAQASGKSGALDITGGRIADIVTVQPGYTLWAISRSNFGQGRFYVRIYHANIDQIANPNLIFPGQLLVVPNLDTTPPRRPFN